MTWPLSQCTGEPPSGHLCKFLFGRDAQALYVSHDHLVHSKLLELLLVYIFQECMNTHASCRSQWETTCLFLTLPLSRTDLHPVFPSELLYMSHQLTLKRVLVFDLVDVLTLFTTEYIHVFVVSFLWLQWRFRFTLDFMNRAKMRSRIVFCENTLRGYSTTRS